MTADEAYKLIDETLTTIANKCSPEDTAELLDTLVILLETRTTYKSKPKNVKKVAGNFVII